MTRSDIYPAKIFLTTYTFLTWQGYCHLRSQIGAKLGFPESFELHTPTEADIKKYILPAKTYRIWLISYKFRQAFLYLFVTIPFNFLKKYLPSPWKIFLKKYFSFVVGLAGGHISTYLRAEFNAWSLKRPDQSLDIIIFGITSYHYRFQRPQQLARAFSLLGHRVFYIESEFNYALTPGSSWIDIKKTAQNIYIVKLSAPQNYFIYKDRPSKRGEEIIFSSIKKLLRVARIVNPIAKIDHPFWGLLTSVLSMPLIYDAMDLHSGFIESGKKIDILENSLAKQADLILTSSSDIARSLSQYKQKSLMIRNAADFTHFSAAHKSLDRPADIKTLPGRIIGYYGAISGWMDDKIIAEVLSAHKNDSVVLIGRIQNKLIENLAKKYPNLHLLGEKSYLDLPRYLSNFDVCLIPFKLTKLILATNPVKIYEYFAAGKPVVSTVIPELKPFAKHLLFGKNPQDFAAKIDQAIAQNTPSHRTLRQSIAKQNTWDVRAKEINTYIFSHFYPKVSVIILVYNHADLSKISIDSVLERSKYPNLELILVDNKSDEETVKMMRTYAGIKHVKLIFNQVNYGFAKGNNIGMKKSTGDYLILLNNDVRVTPGWIERLVYHGKQKGIGLVGPVTNSIGNESKIEIQYNWNNRREIEEKSADYIYSHWGEALKLRNIAAFAWLKPRSVYNLIGGLDERFGRGLFEDDDYCVRVGRAKLAILCAEDAFVHHYGGASTNWGSPEFQLLFNTNKAKFEEKWKAKWIPHQYRQK